MVSEDDAVGEHEISEVLAELFHDRDEARLVASRAGFPLAQLPAFSNPLVFWNKVVEQVSAGVMRGGLSSLVDAALKMLPHNTRLLGIRQRLGGAPVTPAPRESKPQPPAGDVFSVDEFDVFLSHCVADEAAVEAIARRLLAEERLRPFLDKWDLVPGESWLPAIERALSQSKAVAVFFGPGGPGQWREQEKLLALQLAAGDPKRRVIPVLLPGASEEQVQGFLGLRTWVTLLADGDLSRLVAGIRGRAPGPG